MLSQFVTRRDLLDGKDSLLHDLTVRFGLLIFAALSLFFAVFKAF